MSDNGYSNDGDQWRRWNMDDLSRPAGAQPDPDALRRETLRQQTFRRNAELEGLRRQAHEQARQQGYEEGFNQGFIDGKTAGYTQGMDEGRQAGELELQQQTAQALQPLYVLAENFRHALQRLDSQIADHLAALALATGRHLAGEAINAHPDHILSLIRELLHVEPALTGRPRLWLNPADLLLVRARLGVELEAAGWQLQPDELISRGGCRVSSASGELDATWETRWDDLISQLRQSQQTADEHEHEHAHR